MPNQMPCKLCAVSLVLPCLAIFEQLGFLLGSLPMTCSELGHGAALAEGVDTHGHDALAEHDFIDFDEPYRLGR